jgi:hypothetical protein
VALAFFLLLLLLLLLLLFRFLILTSPISVEGGDCNSEGSASPALFYWSQSSNFHRPLQIIRSSVNDRFRQLRVSPVGSGLALPGHRSRRRTGDGRTDRSLIPDPEIADRLLTQRLGRMVRYFEATRRGQDETFERGADLSRQWTFTVTSDDSDERPQPHRRQLG